MCWTEMGVNRIKKIIGIIKACFLFGFIDGYFLSGKF